MVDNAAKPVPLALGPQMPDPDNPFKGDLFEREELANRLTEFLDRLPDGGVLAVDAAWGDGKTWFGRNWHAGLVLQKRRVAYIDAFEADYVEDPFLLLAAEIRQLGGDPEHKKDLTARAAALGKVVLPALAKGLLRGATTIVVGQLATEAIADALEAADDTIGEELGKAIEHRLHDLEERKETTASFKKALTKWAADGERPIIVFVDELDRCRPSFAVQFLERAKHFFEVKNVVFVLLLNKEQLEAAIKGLYGSEIDAETYLTKFITLTVTLPKRVASALEVEDFNMRHIQATGAQLGYPINNHFGMFSDALAGMAAPLGMSYRDLDRAMAYLGICGPLGVSAIVVAYLIALRLRNQELFQALRRGNTSDHEQAIRYLATLIERVGPDAFPLQDIQNIHIAAARGIEALDEEAQIRSIHPIIRRSTFRDLSQVFRYFAARLNLDIS